MFNILIMSITLILVILFSLFNITFSSIFYILISGCLGLVIYLISSLKKSKKLDEKTPTKKEDE